MKWNDLKLPIIQNISNSILGLLTEADISAININKVLSQLTNQIAGEIDKNSSNPTPLSIAKLLKAHNFEPSVIEKILTNSGIDPGIASTVVSNISTNGSVSPGPNVSAVPYPKPKTNGTTPPPTSTSSAPKVTPAPPVTNGVSTGPNVAASKSKTNGTKSPTTGTTTSGTNTPPTAKATSPSNNATSQVMDLFKVLITDPETNRIFRDTETKVADLIAKGRSAYAVEVLNSKAKLLMKNYKDRYKGSP